MTVLLDFYVYILFRSNGIPFYVGKGRKNRWYTHEKSARRGCNTHKDRLIRKILMERRDVPKIKFAENLSNTAAKKLEIFLIKTIGREKDGGPLINKTRGGDGCVEPSDDVRRRMSASHTGVPLSAKTRAAISAAAKGKKKTPEHVAKVAAAITGRVVTEATRKKMSDARRNPSPEFREKLRQAHLGNRLSEETKAKLRIINIGKKLSPEHIAKIKASGAKQNPEFRAKVAENMKRLWAERREAGTVLPYRLSEAGLKSLREARVGKPMSQNQKHKISMALRGKVVPQERRDRIAASLRARKNVV